MTRVMVDGFAHRAGIHCGSTALTDAVRFLGLPWSEPLVFGLASGIAFYLIEADAANPSRLFTGRSGLFDADFAEATGLDFTETSTRDAAEAIAGIRALIDGGEPVLIKSDIRYLPHYATETEFNGHKIVVAGYDDEPGEYYVADTHFEDLQTISASDLEQALASTGGPTFWRECLYGPVRRTDDERPLDEAVQLALQRTSARMLDDPSGLGGLDALDRFAAGGASYRDRPDASWIARFGYQVIEKRGSGGGMFRKLYAGFLEEAHEIAAVPRALASAMHEIASLWTELGAALREEAWKRAEEVATQVAKLERRFHEGVVA